MTTLFFPSHRAISARRFLGLCGLAGILLTMSGARAVMLLGTSDVSANSSVPTGPLAGSGWQYVGTWGGTLGTAIAPNYFITAQHVGGNVGDTFQLSGVNYTAVASYDSPTSDLRIWQVNGTLPGYAPLFSGNNEVGMDLVVIGRGAARSETSVLNTSGEIAGWRERAGSGTQRWGVNTVENVVSRPGLGELLRLTFDRDATPNEAMLAPGDSGGAVFIQEGGVWKLAGVNYGISGPYSESASGPGFAGAIFDAGGLYGQVGSFWVPILDQSFDVPAYSEATRISANKAWIESIALAPEPWQSATVIGLGLAVFAMIRRR